MWKKACPVCQKTWLICEIKWKSSKCKQKTTSLICEIVRTSLECKNFTNLWDHAKGAWSVKKWTNLWDRVKNQAFTFVSVCLFMVKEQSGICFLKWKPKTGEGNTAWRLLMFQNLEDTMVKEKMPTDGHFLCMLAPSSFFFPPKKRETSQHRKKTNLRNNNNALVIFFLTLQRSFWRSEGRSLVSLESRLRNKRTPSWLICWSKKNKIP